MTTFEKNEHRRNEITQEISSIKSMHKGTLNEQFQKVSQKDKEEKLRGPDYVLTKRVKNF